MEKKTSNSHNVLITILVAVILICGYFLVVDFMEKKQISLEKKLVHQLIESGLEEGHADDLIHKYCDPNIEIVYPPDFKLPPYNTNTATGIETVKEILKEWKSDTEHQVEIVNIVAERDNIAVLANMHRTFKLEDKTETYEDHPVVYFFELKDRKISKITAVFDVIDMVEEFKENKY